MPDGTAIAVHEWGAGRPVLLLHAFMSTAEQMWERPGHVAQLIACGRRVIAPDHRGHGASDKPHDARAYPPDVVADDALRVVELLGLGEYDLVGYSFGARIAVRMLARGATPRRVVLGGVGLEAIVSGESALTDWYLDLLGALGTFPPTSDKWATQQRLLAAGADPRALALVLQSRLPTPRPALAEIAQPTRVLVGSDDRHARSAADLVDTLPNAHLELIAGGHMRAVATARFGRRLSAWVCG